MTLRTQTMTAAAASSSLGRRSSPRPTRAGGAPPLGRARSDLHPRSRRWWTAPIFQMSRSGRRQRRRKKLPLTSQLLHPLAPEIATSPRQRPGRPAPSPGRRSTFRTGPCPNSITETRPARLRLRPQLRHRPLPPPARGCPTLTSNGGGSSPAVASRRFGCARSSMGWPITL